MTEPERIWNALIAAAQKAPNEALAPLNVDQVVATSLGARCARPQPPLRNDERIVSWAALFALAASLLLAFAYWPDVAAAWSPPPTIFELPLDLEPLR